MGSQLGATVPLTPGVGFSPAPKARATSQQHAAHMPQDLAGQKVASDHLDTKEVLGGMSLQEGPLRCLALQEVRGQRHLPTRHVRSQALAHAPASIQWQSQGGKQGRHARARKHRQAFLCLGVACLQGFRPRPLKGPHAAFQGLASKSQCTSKRLWTPGVCTGAALTCTAGCRQWSMVRGTASPGGPAFASPAASVECRCACRPNAPHFAGHQILARCHFLDAGPLLMPCRLCRHSLWGGCPTGHGQARSSAALGLGCAPAVGLQLQLWLRHRLCQLSRRRSTKSHRYPPVSLQDRASCSHLSRQQSANGRQPGKVQACRCYRSFRMDRRLRLDGALHSAWPVQLAYCRFQRRQE